MGDLADLWTDDWAKGKPVKVAGEFAAVELEAAWDERAGRWSPWPKQELATYLAGRSDTLLFGGAAGPGKTEWLMEYGIDQMERYASNRGVIFRRVFPSLNRTIIPRLKLKLHNKAKWNANEHSFTFTNGSVLECGSLQYIDDVYDYQGTEYGWIGWEELTEFAEEQYDELLARLRAPRDGIRPHSTATTNPGGRGHTWVKRRFVKPRPDDVDGHMPQPTEVWRPAPLEGVHTPESPPLTRCYVPATHADNPTLLERDPGYLSRVLSLASRGRRKALAEGDWDAIDEIEGAEWTAADLDNGRISPARFKHVRTAHRVVAVDPSSGDEGSDGYGVSVCSLGLDGVGYVEQSHTWRAPVRQMTRRTLDLAEDVGADGIVVERNHGGRWMLEVFRQADQYARVLDVWASDGKRTRARPVAALFQPMETEPKWRARLVGFHEDLEEQLTTTVFEEKVNGVRKLTDSPDELDAMVWGLSYLMLGRTSARVTGTLVQAGRDPRLRRR